MSIRARLTAVTSNFNWGLLSGKYFAFDFDLDDPTTKLLCEYKFQYSMNSQKKCFRVMLYNKTGTYTPAMQSFVKQLKGFNVGSGFFKSALFCIAILLFLWITTKCRKHESTPEDDSIMSSVCEYKTTVFFTMALGVLIIVTIGNVFSKIGSLKQRIKAAKKN